jgi:hypothetical protein
MKKDHNNKEATDIIELVEKETLLPNFPISEFRDEICEHISCREFEFAQYVIKLAIKKIHKTPKDKFNEAYGKYAILNELRSVLEDLKENDPDSSDTESDEIDDPIDDFPYISLSEIFQTYKIDTFEEIEKRLFQEGFLNNFDGWNKEQEALLTFINSLFSNGFFKSRTKNGSWINFNYYIEFFACRYDIEFKDTSGSYGILKGDYQSYFPWLHEYFE